MPKLLAIDDDEKFLLSLKNLLSYKKYDLTTCSNPYKAKESFSKGYYNCILLDVKMPGIDGIQLLKSFSETDPLVPIIMVSGQSTITLAMDAIKLGAFDFIEKPVDADRLLITIRNAIEKRSWFDEKQGLLSQLGESYKMIGKSEAIQKVYKLIEQVAPTNAKVLILGETGTGKELVARALHYNSKRKSKPFFKLNCAAIPSELLESELFGFKKGAFTGANRDFKGKFLEADKGTLFLDEIGDMPANLQSKLLRVLQEGEVESIRDPHPQKVDVRIITASSKNIPQMTKEKKFREDLFHRISVVPIWIPHLRDRKEDVPDLAKYFLTQHCQAYNKQIRDFSPKAIAQLISYHWPGNIRELRNIIEKTVIFTKNHIVQQDDIIQAMQEPQPQKQKKMIENLTLQQARQDFEKDYILQYLTAFNWRIQDTATAIGIDRTTLFKKMNKLHIDKNLNKLKMN
jgi:DNA-binding NtrC family response regulator